MNRIGKWNPVHSQPVYESFDMVFARSLIAPSIFFFFFI